MCGMKIIRTPLFASLVVLASVLFGVVPSQAQTSMTRAQLQNCINANIIDNTFGLVSPSKLRQCLLDQAASTATLLDQNSLPVYNLSSVGSSTGYTIISPGSGGGPP